MPSKEDLNICVIKTEKILNRVGKRAQLCLFSISDVKPAGFLVLLTQDRFYGHEFGISSLRHEGKSFDDTEE